MDVVINENDLKDLFCMAKNSIFFFKNSPNEPFNDRYDFAEEDIDLIESRLKETKNRLEKCHTLLGEEIETNRNLKTKLQEMQEKIEVLEGKEILP